MSRRARAVAVRAVLVAGGALLAVVVAGLNRMPSPRRPELSVPLPGWFSSEQDRPIASQLRDGIRGLLIDTHYAGGWPTLRQMIDMRSRSPRS